MRRLAFPLLAALAASGCVSVQSLPDPRGALRPGQRLVLAVYPAPGPWIVDAADSKAEAAAKISPVGFLMQSVQNEHTLTVSKDLQQYMPRPHYALAVHDAMLAALRATASTKTVQTTLEAGLVPAQLIEWNKAKDQLDWRLRYYAPDPDQPAPRDYARALTLDDALILDVNVSYGTNATDEGQIFPEMTAASRVYRGDTSRLIWEHEDEVSDKTSSTTLAEFKLQPWDLTNRLEKLSPVLGRTVAASFIKAFGLTAPVPVAPPPGSAAAGGGLVPIDMLRNLAPSTATTPTPPAPPATVAASTSAAVSPPAPPPAASSATATAAASPGMPPVQASTQTAPSGTTVTGTVPVTASSPTATTPPNPGP